MAVATRTQYWTSRINGEDPTDPEQVHHNTAFSVVGSGASANGDYWRVTDAQYTVTHTETSATLLIALKVDTLPASDEEIASLSIGDKKVSVLLTSNASKLKLVGTTTTTVTGLDLKMAEDDAFLTILRLSNDGTTGKLWVHEAVEDEMGEALGYSVTCETALGSGTAIKWGNNNGTVDWASTYASTFGAFSPDELGHSAFYQSLLNSTGLSFRNMLRESKRLHLKALPDASIVYGYDVSSSMIVRLAPPTIHVLVKGAEAPDFSAISGTSIDQEYELSVFVTTKGTDYADAYRFGLRILGDVFDEAYTNTGLNATQDSLMSYRVMLDTKVDNDEQVCVHRIEFTYRKREKMLTR
jgi:hypothetical protein